MNLKGEIEMEQKFADKLREIANQTSEDDVLIQKLNLMFERYAPGLKKASRRRSKRSN